MLGLRLAPIVNQPATRDVVSVQIVEIITLEVRRYVALVLVARVVAVLPLLPAEIVEQFLGHVPFLHRRVEGTEHDARAHGGKGQFAAPPHPHALLAIQGLGPGASTAKQNHQGGTDGNGTRGPHRRSA